MFAGECIMFGAAFKKLQCCFWYFAGICVVHVFVCFVCSMYLTGDSRGQAWVEGSHSTMQAAYQDCLCAQYYQYARQPQVEGDKFVVRPRFKIVILYGGFVNHVIRLHVFRFDVGGKHAF